ncbi:MAG: nucleoside triphosphate pyrophosphohydrolase family protein [Ktedonobacterales bacterium]
MDIDTYRADVRRTMPDLPFREQLLCGALGIGGEAGECIDLVKKHVFQGHDLDRATIRDEAGDLLFYLVYLLDVCGISLTEVMPANVQKRRERYPTGFTVERSRNRDGGESEASA